MELNFTKFVYREDIDLLLEVHQEEDPFPEMIDGPHQEELYVDVEYQMDQTVDW